MSYTDPRAPACHSAPLFSSCELAWHPIPDRYPHTTGIPASRVKPESAIPRRQPSCVPRACGGEFSLVYQVREKSWKAVNLERKEFIMLVLFFSFEFLELSVTKAQSFLPVPIARVIELLWTSFPHRTLKIRFANVCKNDLQANVCDACSL